MRLCGTEWNPKTTGGMGKVISRTCVLIKPWETCRIRLDVFLNTNATGSHIQSQICRSTGHRNRKSSSIGLLSNWINKQHHHIPLRVETYFAPLPGPFDNAALASDGWHELVMFLEAVERPAKIIKKCPVLTGNETPEKKTLATQNWSGPRSALELCLCSMHDVSGEISFHFIEVFQLAQGGGRFAWAPF